MEFPSFDILRLLKESSLQHVEYHEKLASTNSTAQALLGPLLERAPSLVLTSMQTAGRGRKGNQWWSAPGALTFTLIVAANDLPVSVERRPLISLAAGLAVRDALSELASDQEFWLKWPNDVLAGTQKISGILVEQHTVDTRPTLLIGIGVNVNNSMKEAPADIRLRATSLFDLSGHSSDLTTVLIAILKRLDFRISQLTSQPRMALSDANRFHLLTGRSLCVQQGEERISGDCLGIDEDGQLVLQCENGVRRCASGIVAQW
jgi:BirA family biotin operon repressor/biotin-[acetyl-CoA-carboxylase] ligase